VLGRKGQGALEYLLLLAAILVVAVVVILVMTNVQSKAGVKEVSEDKYKCSLAGISLLDYEEPYDGSLETAPGKIEACQGCSAIDKKMLLDKTTIENSDYAILLNTTEAFASCQIRNYTLYVYLYDNYSFGLLESDDDKYISYGFEINPIGPLPEPGPSPRPGPGLVGITR